jgi:hypothetical protein
MSAAISNRHGTLLISAAAVVISFLACSPDAPSCIDKYGRGTVGPTAVDISCRPIGPNLRCQAVATNRYDMYVYCPMQQDVTQSADWMIADPGIVTSVEPGVFRAVGIGETFVRAKWTYFTSVMQPISAFTGTPPLPTSEIRGRVWQAGQTPATSYIDGAVIQILDGLVAGRMTMSGTPPPLPPGYYSAAAEQGRYRLLGIPAGTYRLRITKDGYVSQEREVTVNPPGGPAADFQLQPD